MAVIEQLRPPMSIAANEIGLAEPVPQQKTKAFVALYDIVGATIAAALVPISLIWDYSWESSIGVDRVWSPPHLMTHSAVWIAALVALRLVVSFSVAGRSEVVGTGVKLGPFITPAGGWVLLWSVALFELIFPLDLWWQQAYGLGAGIWPPPQILKATSFVGLQFGALMLITASQTTQRVREWLLAVNFGTMLALCGIMLGTATLSNLQHGAHFYKLCAGIFSVVIVAAGVASESHWSATKAALIYSVLCAAMVWLLPLFPAQPLTSPVHNPMDHFMPPQFPLLLVLPAIAIDCVKRWMKEQAGWQHALRKSLVASVMFVTTFLPGQWFFATFQLSPAADNRFFAGGGKHWPYFLKIESARTIFWQNAQDALNWKAIGVVLALAFVSTFVGLHIGKFLKHLRC